MFKYYYFQRLNRPILYCYKFELKGKSYEIMILMTQWHIKKQQFKNI